jgi:adenylate cyclase
LVGGTTISQMKLAKSWREIDLIRITGSDKLISVFELLDSYPAAVRTDLSRMRSTYQRGIQFYRQRRWLEAILIFEQVLARCPDDRPSRIYVDRCRYFIDEPPGNDWDGVWSPTKN